LESLDSSWQSPSQIVGEDEVGYLIVGHGTRSKAGQDQVRGVFNQMTQLDGADSLSGAPAELAFLELAEPDIPTAVERLFHAGVRQLVVVPVLLFSAGHARQDIPDAVESAANRLGMQIHRQCSSLCLDPAIVKLSAERFHRALELHAGIRPDANLIAEGVALALVGRGSSSEQATAAMLQFAELRARATPVAWSSVGFIHAQRPTVDEALDGLAATGLPWLVVQPHLLFEGELVDELRREVAYRQSFSSSQKWIVTETLGSDANDQRLAATLSQLALRSDLATSDSGHCLRCLSPKQWCASQAVTPYKN
jgi:sirohydrochlorin cobaltochelatase